MGDTITSSSTQGPGTYWPTMILNAVAYAANSVEVHPNAWIVGAKWGLTILAAMLTVVSFINQTITLYSNAHKYHVVMIVKKYFIKVKRKKNNTLKK